MENKKRILVVVDMQKDFTSGVLGNAECMAAIPQVLDVIKNGAYDSVIATRDTHGEDYMNTTEGKHLPVVHCIKDTDGWELVPEIEEAIKEANGGDIKIFDKPTFGSVELGAYLQKEYEKAEKLEIDLVGVCTGICVISNATLAKAFCPNADVRVIAKACACVTPDTHKTALAAMATFQVEVIE